MSKVLPIPDSPSKPSELYLAGQMYQADSETAEVYPNNKYYLDIYV